MTRDKEKAAAVRTLRAELGTTQGTVQRVATRLGYGVESVRTWVKQADIDDGVMPGVSTAEAARVRELEQENRELRRANEVLKPRRGNGVDRSPSRATRAHRSRPGSTPTPCPLTRSRRCPGGRARKAP